MAIRSLPLIAALVLAVSGPAEAREIIRCTSPTASDVVVTLHDTKFDGRWLDCVSGEFAADLTPCAPDGGFALSAPTGSASIVQIVDHWQDYAKHLGGVTSAFTTASEIHFDAGFNNPGKGLSRDWSFAVDRLTGRAVLTIAERKQPANFTCTKAAPKL